MSDAPSTTTPASSTKPAKIDPKKIAEVGKLVHRTAVEKGWWGDGVDPDNHDASLSEKRNFDEVLFLYISELAEAFEIAREKDFDPRKIWLGGPEGKKPEGYPIELADCAIRILDSMAAACLDIEACMNFQIAEMAATRFGNQIFKNDPLARIMSGFDGLQPIPDNAGEACMLITKVFAVASDKPKLFPILAAKALYMLFTLAAKYDIDLMAAIMQKQEYNATRPFRHGGKRA
jgi:hypothetical protein